MKYRYFEIICSVGVIGCCCDAGKGDDTLLHAAQEDRVLAFGLITKDAFDRFGDHPWVRPISKIRFKPTREGRARAPSHTMPTITDQDVHDAAKRWFIHQLAEFLVGRQAAKSIMLQLEGSRIDGDPRPNFANEWATLRCASNLSGYPTIEEAEKALTKLLQ
jgi:hypothetical protein